MKKYIFKTLIVGKLDDTENKLIFSPQYTLNGKLTHYIETISNHIVKEEKIKEKETIFNYYDMGMVDGLKYADRNLIIDMYLSINKPKTKAR